jgi:hypothetical protein
MPAAKSANAAAHLGAFFVGVIAFAATCLVFVVTLPFPEVSAIAPKYRYFARNRDKFDVLFLGSSRVYHQVIPAEFDAAVEKLTGHRTHSFNAAYDAVWPPESYYYLRQILALRPSKLRWVVIDAMDIDPKLEDPERPTRRQVYWHDWEHTRMVLESIREQGERAAPLKGDRDQLARDHLSIFIKRNINLGRGAEVVSSLLVPRRLKDTRPPDWDGAEGYHSGGDQGLTGSARAGYLVTVNRLREGLATVKPNAAFWNAMSRLVEDVRRAGAEPIFTIAPTLNERENIGEVPGGAALIALNDPVKYPVLFDPDLHYDGWHLNEKGAHDFTRLLAEHFVAKTGGAAQPGHPTRASK